MSKPKENTNLKKKLTYSRPWKFYLLEDQSAMIISAFVQSTKSQENSLNLITRYFQTWMCRIGHAARFHLFTHSLSLSLSLYIYIYIYTQFIYFFTFLPPLWGCSPKRTMASTFFRFVDSTQRHTANSLEVLWTSDQPIAETSTWQHTTLTTDKHQCPAVGFEPTIPARQRLQTQALDRTATGTGIYS